MTIKHLNVIQMLRLKQMFLALFMAMASQLLLSTYEVPDMPPLEAFLTPTQILHYTLLQLLFLLSFISAAVLLGMLIQARQQGVR
jgi:hypothetical protein